MLRTGSGATPLHVAAAQGPRAIVQALLHAGADPISPREERVGAMRSTSGALPVELSTWRTRSGVSIRALLWEAALLRLPHYGWLHLQDQTKGGRLNSECKAWRHRFVLLLPGQLRLFNDYKLKKYRQRIDLAGLRAVACVQPAPRGAPTPHAFEFASGGRTYHFCAPAARDLATWLQ